MIWGRLQADYREQTQACEHTCCESFGRTGVAGLSGSSQTKFVRRASWLDVTLGTRVSGQLLHLSCQVLTSAALYPITLLLTDLADPDSLWCTLSCQPEQDLFLVQASLMAAQAPNICISDPALEGVLGQHCLPRLTAQQLLQLRAASRCANDILRYHISACMMIASPASM